MIGLHKGMQKLIASGIALLITLTTMCVAVFAILSTEKVGLSVNVSFDSAVTAKVYLATNSSTATQFYQDSPTVDGADGTTAFNTENSALVLDTYQGTALDKIDFEALGAGSANGLKCDANGEMEFYVYVENYSTTESIFYCANIDFVGTDDKTAEFTILNNPTYETAETAVALGSPFISLLTFKIKSTNETGLNANTIRIQIDLKNEKPWYWTITQYTEGAFADMYYFEMGKAPQSYAGTTSTITATQQATQWIDNSYYYTDTSNPNIQYVLKSAKYYLVEPVRWIILADGNYVNDQTGTYGIDYFARCNPAKDNLSTSQMYVVSEKILGKANYSTSNDTASSLKIFTDSERNWFNTVSVKTWESTVSNLSNTSYFLMGGYENDATKDNFSIASYLTTPSSRIAYETSYSALITTVPASASYYWCRGYKYISGSNYYFNISDNGGFSANYNATNIWGIRPGFVISTEK